MGNQPAVFLASTPDKVARNASPVRDDGCVLSPHGGTIAGRRLVGPLFEYLAKVGRMAEAARLRQFIYPQVVMLKEILCTLQPNTRQIVIEAYLSFAAKESG